MDRKKWNNGPHLLEFEPPDIYHCYLLAPTKPEEVKETFRVLEEEVFPQVGPIFYLIHLRPGVGGFPPEARSVLAGVKPRWKAMIFIGGTPVLRVAANIVARAINLLVGKQTPTRAVETDEEAYELVNRLRAAERTPED